jgi:hypothetical protein
MPCQIFTQRGKKMIALKLPPRQPPMSNKEIAKLGIVYILLSVGVVTLAYLGMQYVLSLVKMAGWI